MYIIFDKTTKDIVGSGFEGKPAVIDGRIMVDDLCICSDAENYNYKHIKKQNLKADENGQFIYTADDYEEIEPDLTIAELQEQIAATNSILLDLYLGV